MPFLVVANWKTNGSAASANAFVDALCSTDVLSEGVGRYEVVLCPPFTAMPFLSLDGKSIDLGAQDCFPKARKGCTGEISPAMLRDCGCKYVILGHSDRRILLNEQNEYIKLKAEGAIEEGLVPIICIGETKGERESGNSDNVLLEQCKACFPDRGGFIVAYEPIWANGGSVNESNICSLINGVSDISGVLVGNASLGVSSFSKILNNLMGCL